MTESMVAIFGDEESLRLQLACTPVELGFRVRATGWLPRPTRSTWKAFELAIGAGGFKGWHPTPAAATGTDHRPSRTSRRR